MLHVTQRRRITVPVLVFGIGLKLVCTLEGPDSAGLSILTTACRVDTDHRRALEAHGCGAIAAIEVGVGAVVLCRGGKIATSGLLVAELAAINVTWTLAKGVLELVDMHLLLTCEVVLSNNFSILW